jgi:hypothetical protein
MELGAKSKGQRAKSKEPRAKSQEQRAWRRSMAEVRVKEGRSKN